NGSRDIQLHSANAIVSTKPSNEASVNCHGLLHLRCFAVQYTDAMTPVSKATSARAGQRRTSNTFAPSHNQGVALDCWLTTKPIGVSSIIVSHHTHRNGQPCTRDCL